MARYTYDTSNMTNRDNHALNSYIEQFIEQWFGTSKGSDVKNMYENGTSYESILDRIGLEYNEEE